MARGPWIASAVSSEKIIKQFLGIGGPESFFGAPEKVARGFYSLGRSGRGRVLYDATPANQDTIFGACDCANGKRSPLCVAAHLPCSLLGANLLRKAARVSIPRVEGRSIVVDTNQQKWGGMRCLLPRPPRTGRSDFAAGICARKASKKTNRWGFCRLRPLGWHEMVILNAELQRGTAPGPGNWQKEYGSKRDQCKTGG